MLADLVVVEQNPVENLKVLYGTGWMKLNDKTGNACVACPTGVMEQLPLHRQDYRDVYGPWTDFTRYSSFPSLRMIT